VNAPEAQILAVLVGMHACRDHRHSAAWPGAGLGLLLACRAEEEAARCRVGGGGVARAHQLGRHTALVRAAHPAAGILAQQPAGYTEDQRGTVGVAAGHTWGQGLRPVT
jgi:hypothetical protein